MSSIHVTKNIRVASFSLYHEKNLVASDFEAAKVFKNPSKNYKSFFINRHILCFRSRKARRKSALSRSYHLFLIQLSDRSALVNSWRRLKYERRCKVCKKG